MSTTARRKPGGRLPRRFGDLNDLFPLFPIHDEASYAQAQEIADQLSGRGDLSAGQDRYLETLSILMEEYEEARHAIDTSSLDSIGTLRFLLESHGMTGSDLGKLLGQRQVGSRILGRKRELSKAQIVKLARHFKVSPAVFLDPL